MIKVTNKYLHENSIAFANDKTFHNINENIIMEASILKQLTKHKHAPNSIVKYRGFFERYENLVFTFFERVYKYCIQNYCQNRHKS